MELFHVTHDFNPQVGFGDGNIITVPLKKPEDKPNLASIYACTGACLETIRQRIASTPKEQLPDGLKLKVLNTMNKKKIYNTDAFPRVLSNFDGCLEEKDFPYNDPQSYKHIPSTPFVPLEEQIEDIDGDTIKVFIINGMGTGLGDGMCGLAALNVFYKRLKQKYKNVIIDIGQPMIIGDKSHQALYSQEAIINNLQYLPVPVEKLLDYDLLMDNSAMIIRESFPKQAMTDFFLENLGIDPKTVPASEKKIFIKKNERAEASLAASLSLLRQDPTKKLILLHSQASTVIRSIPRDVIKRIIKQILDSDKDYIVVSLENMDDIKDDILKYLGPKKHRYVNLSFKATAFDIYSYVISQMDGLVTADTSSYHIANAYDVPAVVIFQTIDPKLRIRDYPLCSAIEISKDKSLRGIHISQEQKHIDVLMQHWRDFDTKKIPAELKTVMIRKRVSLNDDKNYTICPICSTKCKKAVVDRLGLSAMAECHNCGAEFALERKETNHVELYNSGIYSGYLNEGKPDELIKATLSNLRFEPFVDVMQTVFTPGKNFLDFGCASGVVVAYARGVGYDAYGIDVAEKAISFGQRVFGLGDKINVGQTMDVSQFAPHFPKEYDIISSLEVINMLADPNAFAKQVYAALKPGGYWIFSTPNRNRIQNSAGVKNGLRHSSLINGDYPESSLQRFRPDTHRILADNAGFILVHQQTSRIENTTIFDVAGQPPDINITLEDNKQAAIPKEGIKTFMGMFYQSLLDGATGFGNHLITVVRKPLK